MHSLAPGFRRGTLAGCPCFDSVLSEDIGAGLQLPSCNAAVAATDGAAAVASVTAGGIDAAGSCATAGATSVIVELAGTAAIFRSMF